MGLWDRVETIIKSYVNSTEPKTGSNTGRNRAAYGDPDLNAAYDELDDFLYGNGEKKAAPKPEKASTLPREVREAFLELGLQENANPEECREAYKNLLKIHHPDRHAKHPGNMEKATRKTARVNAAYERLEKWFNYKNGK